MEWWAITAVSNFIYNMSQFGRVMAAAEEQRELHRAMDRISEMVQAL